MENELDRLTEKLTELQTKQTASDAVFSTVLAVVLTHLDQTIRENLLSALRSDLNVSSNAEGQPLAEHMKLVAEEHINSIVDQIERTVRGRGERSAG